MQSKPRSCLLVYTVLLVSNGLALIALSLWLLIDPAKNYLLNLVDLSEDDPLLKFAVYCCLAVGISMVFVAFVGCFGTVVSGKFMLIMYILLMILLTLASVVVTAMPIMFKNKFADNRMPIYLANFSQNRYYRDKWVTPLMDSIQFYGKCCGGKGGYLDYMNSFWFITNLERGTRSFVPPSCCKQSQDGRAWAPRPVDPLCITYPYGSSAFNNSVNTNGCGAQLTQVMDNVVLYLAAIGVASMFVLLVGVATSFHLFRRLRWYSYVPE